jgi:hypothetical protein
MAAPRSEHRLAKWDLWWGGPTVRSMGIALAVVPLLVPLLSRGGLAPIVVAAGVALLLGTPAAIAEWRTPLHGGPTPNAGLRAALSSTAEVTGVLLVSSALAALAHTGAVGVLLATGAWIAGSLLTHRPGWAAAPALVGVLGIAAATGLDLRLAPPWTLLEPHWEALPETIGAALVAGVLLAGAGTGQWALSGPRPPGDRFAPWAAVGLGLGAVTLLTLDAGARFEAALGDPELLGSLPVTLATALALVSATAAVAGRSGGPGIGRLRVAVGLGVTLLLAGPAWEIRPWVTLGLVPLAAAFCLGAAAVRAAGADRVALGAAAAVLVGAAASAWPGLPDRTLDAVGVGAAVVAAFWFVATRSVLARRTA